MKHEPSHYLDAMSNVAPAKATADLSYQELKDLLEKKKESEINKVTKELVAAEGIVTSLRAQLANLGVHSEPKDLGPAPKKRGRPIKSTASRNGTIRKAEKTVGPRRGSVGKAIAEYVAKKGKAGAHVKDIADALGMKKQNVTAFFYSKANKGNYKALGGATFAAR